MGAKDLYRLATLCLCLSACCLSSLQTWPLAGTQKVSEPIFPPPPPLFYEFGYKVNSTKHKNQFSHQEVKRGHRVTGEYRVLLPDGRTQVVSYYVTKDSGYVATVTYV